MIKIAFFNQKGGVGKTTSVVNIAATMSEICKKKVLVVDCDSQSTASMYLGAYTNYQYSLDDYFNDVYYDLTADKLISRVELKKSVNKEVTEKSNIWLLPTTPDIKDAEVKDVYVMKSILDSVEEKFDFCLFDLPPHLTGISLSSLVASDFVIVPIKADTDSLNGYNYLIDTISSIRTSGYNLHLKVLGILCNDIKLQRGIEKHIFNESMANMKDLMLKPYIKSTASIVTARYMNIPLICTNLDKSTKSSYIELTKNIIKRAKEMSNKNA